MEFFRLAAICLLGALLSVCLKQMSAPFSMLLTVFVSVSAVGACAVYFLPFLDFFRQTAEGTPFSGYAGILIKVCGIGILTRIGAALCRDAGENGFASNVTLVGKTAILLCALPVIRTLFAQITALLD